MVDYYISVCIFLFLKYLFSYLCKDLEQIENIDKGDNQPNLDEMTHISGQLFET